MADNPVWDEEKNELRVMNGKCSTCIFGPKSLILAQDTRKLIAKARQDPEGGNIICHKTIKVFAGDVPGAMCYGYWARFFQYTFLGRLARSWDLIHWWKEPEKKCSESSS